MEKAALEFTSWTLPRNDIVRSSKAFSVEILNRFPFSSALKRMSCVVKLSNDELAVVSKGAPETMQQYFKSIPSWYEDSFNSLALNGSRVIALGRKSLKSISMASVRSMKREAAESDLEFCGFLVFRCPLKSDSKSVIKALKDSSHRVMMITGDNALTAISTAKEVDMSDTESFVLIDVEGDILKSKTIESGTIRTTKINDLYSDPIQYSQKHSLCFTGCSLDRLAQDNPEVLNMIFPYVVVFARTNPAQKEFILTSLKSLGYITLMCGDGTNDVGALKQSHVGVALLDGKPEALKDILNQMQRIAIKKRRAEAEQARLKWQAKLETVKTDSEAQKSLISESLQRKMEELNASADDEVPMVKLGDASVAAPFTSKISTIESVCNIIRQGRCTLVTTIQMYKILALNSLISAYGLSVLHLAGIRYGDFQVTITGLLLSGCFLFLTRSQPISKLSSKRPQPNILNLYLLSSVLLQFGIHIFTLVNVMSEANRYSFPHKISHKAEFSPSIVNTAVYLLSLVMQVSTFVVNYQGRPFRESLMENKNLRNSLLAVSGIAIFAALEVMPEFNEWLQLVPMPPSFQYKLISLLCLDFFGCLIAERTAHFLFFNANVKY